jgi:hypothetical protein
MEQYRELTTREENEYERLMAEQVMKLFCRKLGLRNIGLGFIAPDPFGEHSFETPINGFCPPGGREIFIRRGLSDRELTLSVLHELRHCWQRQTRKQSLSKAFMEQDARIYELQINPPQTGPEIRRWLYLAEAFDEDPELRDTFARVDAIMRERGVAA